MWRVVLLMALVIAGCHAPLPPSPREIEAKRFEPVAGKSVIYILRDKPDADVASTIVLGDSASITTYPGTFYRWEAAPGRHLVRGMAGDNGAITLDVAAGRVYFVQQWLQPLSGARSFFKVISESEGRAVVARAQFVPGAQ